MTGSSAPRGGTPREGIYLDAALAVIGEQIDERIDELERRRRLRTRIGIAALSLVTIASGSVAAIAITTTAQNTDAAAAAAHTIETEVQCIDGLDPTGPAYFAASFRTREDTTVDEARVCAAARAMLAEDGAVVAGESPSELVVRADELVEAAVVPTGERETADAATIDEASFGRLSPIGGPVMTPCALDGTLVVLTTPQGGSPLSAVERASLCAGARR